MKAEQTRPGVWEFKCEGMRVPGRVYATEKLYSSIEEGVFKQVSNVAGLPGILKASMAMPDAHYGYGAIQAHSGENIVFRNIKSIGGVAVRLETGAGKMNLARIGGLFDIAVENAVNINGQAALMFQPHTMNHGHVVARNISSDGSEFAVSVAPPFVSKKKFGGKGEFVP